MKEQQARLYPRGGSSGGDEPLSVFGGLGKVFDTIVMASQPTPPHVPPSEMAGLMIRAYENHWFPLLRPVIQPSFLRGVCWGGRLTSHDSGSHAILDTHGQSTWRSVQEGGSVQGFHKPIHGNSAIYFYPGVYFVTRIILNHSNASSDF